MIAKIFILCILLFILFHLLVGLFPNQNTKSILMKLIILIGMSFCVALATTSLFRTEEKPNIIKEAYYKGISFQVKVKAEINPDSLHIKITDADTLFYINK